MFVCVQAPDSYFNINSIFFNLNYLPMRYNRIIIMTNLQTVIIFLFTITLVTSQSTTDCIQYLDQLQNLYNTSQAQFAQAMAPYLVYSGKILDDMGFPISCLKNPSNAYWEVQISLTQEVQQAELTMYYGFCFTNQCNAQTLNQQSGFFIDAIFQNMTEIGYQINSIEFFPVNMNAQYTVASVLLSVIFSLFILTRLISSYIKWGKLCVTDSEEEALAIEMEDLQEDKDAGRMPEHTLTFLEKYSLQRAFGKLFQKQESNKILGFSLFKIFSIPFIAFGYLFYLSNYGAYNYFSFNSQVYQAFFAKVATFAYYLPDIFFYISGFIFSRKLIHLDEADQNHKQMNILAALARKMIKLYPLYLAMLLIYWFITPSLHAGPLWNVYMDQIGQCNSNWWRSLIMIDNWFTEGCFSFSWYVQVEVQFVLLACIIFVVYGRKRVVAFVIIYILLITSFILVFVLGGMLPSSIQTAISDGATLYLQAFYSHLFFYLFGLYSAFIFDKLSVRTFVKTNMLENPTIFATLIVVAFSLIIFIILRPEVWENNLVAELAFCRIGIMIGFLILFLPSMASDEVNTTIIHKLSKLTYGIILNIGLITACGFWGLNYFSYVDAMNILQSSLTNVLLSIAVGGALGVIFDITPFTLTR